MIDPLSVAGLTITILDDLLRLGERTAEYISDVRAFNEESKHFYNDIIAENHKTQILQQLLFRPSPTYGGQTLFQQFDEDAKDQVKVSLGRLVNVLREAHDILKVRYGSSGSVRSASSDVLTRSGAEVSLENPAAPSRRLDRSPLLMLKWSFRDKKRVETIIADFSKLNGGIHEYIKFICLGSTIGIGLKHLEHLQEDENSIGLGFNVDATLRITVNCAKDLPGTLELSDSWTQPLLALPAPEHFSIFVKDEKAYLCESRPYELRDWDSVGLDPLASHRVNALARLLQQPKEQVFRIPRCVGWKYMETQRSIAFIFESPSRHYSKPVSLISLIASDQEKPSLDSKFKLAYSFAKGIAQIHLVKWLHESLCSENIIFFPPDSPPENGRTTIDYSQPWIIGFYLSRPEGELSYGPVELHPERDVYRHPDRQGQVHKQFTKLHDIYAFGVVLLEIGLWTPAVSLQSKGFSTARNPKVIRDQLIKHADRRLSSHMGPKYQALVLKCLRGDFGIENDTKEDLKLQQAFRTQVVDVLKRAAENV